MSDTLIFTYFFPLYLAARLDFLSRRDGRDTLIEIRVLRLPFFC